jgi:hypothetical protein
MTILMLTDTNGNNTMIYHEMSDNLPIMILLFIRSVVQIDKRIIAKYFRQPPLYKS